MKVKDLIKKLSEYRDQEMEVFALDPHNPFHNAFGISKIHIERADVLNIYKNENASGNCLLLSLIT